MGFVPDQLNATLWDDLEPLYEDLVGRSLDSIEQLENMIKDESELREWVSEAGSRLYVAMTCSTEDDTKSKSTNSKKILKRECKRSERAGRSLRRNCRVS